jgi:hypothetical protein
VRDVPEGVPASYREDAAFTEAASHLADRYLQAAVVGRASRLDAQHIATATVHRANVPVSWNFKHVVNLDRIQGTIRIYAKAIRCWKSDRPGWCSPMTDEKKRREKRFDAVQLMRNLREKLSRERDGMSCEEEKEYIRKRVPLEDTPSQGNSPEKAA